LSELSGVLKPDGTIKNRRGHAILDLNSRDAKARKIETLLNLTGKDRTIRMLEVGTGSGGIAHYFGSHPTLRVKVESVDVSDTRQIFDDYNFTKVTDTNLPFSDNSFDVVISNHVIEHVGNTDAQRHHLNELHRVLCQDGVGYLAVPNRWQLVEPHYRLAFLSWLPERWRSPYLRWRNRGSEYDCRPLTVDDLESLLNESGFLHKQQHSQALRLTYQLERPGAFAYQGLLRWVPDFAYASMRRAFPTLIYVMWPKTSGPRS
jgi:phosphatidyl-myo-inositol dimannoside synthase